MRYSVTISDCTADEAVALLSGSRPETVSVEEATARLETAAGKGKGKRTTAPASLPANTSAPAAPAAPSAAPAAAAAEPEAAKEEVVQVAAKLTAVDTTGLTLDGLVAKCRIVGTGPLKQMALVSVLRAMGAPSVNKIPVEQYPAFDALLDAVTAYAGTPGASSDGLKEVCQAGKYDDAITSLHGLVAASMGL